MHQKHLRDLLATPAQAAVYCCFCHALWTLCEQAEICSTPYATDQIAELCRLHPEFVAHFKGRTKEVGLGDHSFRDGCEHERGGEIAPRYTPEAVRW